VCEKTRGGQKGTGGHKGGGKKRNIEWKKRKFLWVMFRGPGGKLVVCDRKRVKRRKESFAHLPA